MKPVSASVSRNLLATKKLPMHHLTQASPPGIPLFAERETEAPREKELTRSHAESLWAVDILNEGLMETRASGFTRY